MASVNRMTLLGIGKSSVPDGALNRLLGIGKSSVPEGALNHSPVSPLMPDRRHAGRPARART